MKKHTLSSLAATIALASFSSGATPVAINFIRNDTTTPAANDGTEYGIDTWEDVLVGDTSATIDGLSLSWNPAGGWNGGGNNIINGYLDNAGSITVSGLAAWMTANSAVSYTVQTIGASDTDSNWFGDTLLRENSATGDLLDTLTNPNFRNGPSTISVDLTADILYIDPTNQGTVPPDAPSDAAPRTSVAALIITAKVIPAPENVTILSTEFLEDSGDGVNSEFRITVEGTAGFKYQLLRSPDLAAEFVAVSEPSEASEETLELVYSFPIGTDPKAFFQVARTAN